MHPCTKHSNTMSESFCRLALLSHEITYTDLQKWQFHVVHPNAIPFTRLSCNFLLTSLCPLYDFISPLARIVPDIIVRSYLACWMDGWMDKREIIRGQGWCVVQWVRPYLWYQDPRVPVWDPDALLPIQFSANVSAKQQNVAKYFEPLPPGRAKWSFCLAGFGLCPFEEWTSRWKISATLLSK